MNNQIFFFFYNFAHQSAFFDRLIVFTAETFPYIVIIIAGIFLLFHHDVSGAENLFRVFMQKRKEILLVFLSGALAWVTALILKIIFHIPRPFLEFPDIHPLFIKTTFSFPSEHAMFFSALSFEIFLLHKKAGLVFIFFAIIIGVMRIVAGVHFPMDILGGFIFGFIIAYVTKKFLLKNI